MSDLGLGNLISLKRQVLGASLYSRTTWDAQLAEIGKGVAKQFDKFCNRKFQRSVGATDEFNADRQSWILERYPVETVTAFKLRTDMASGFVSLGAVDTIILNRDDKAGIIHFGLQGNYQNKLQVTYTGGYWFDDAETENTSQPAGSTLVPDDVKEAWYLQCKRVAEVSDLLSTDFAGEKKGESLLGTASPTLELTPQVKQMLQGHIRMAVT